MEDIEMDSKSKARSEPGLDTEPEPKSELAAQSEPRPQPGSGQIPQLASAPALELREVSVRLGGRQILDEVSFRIAPGEFTGLIGSNGAGKTTMLRIILGLRAADAGDVFVNGRSAGGSGRRCAGGLRIGYVPQKIQLEADAPLRARDLVALGLDGGRLGPRLPSRARRETVERMLASVGATAFADERVGTLSGGEQQRILIAHALIAQPRLLLMDEPLANLDLRSGQEVVELVSQVAREHAVAVLLSAHDINPLLPVMDKVVYLAEGRAAAGTTEQVVRSDVLSGLYQHPISVLRVDGRILVVAGSTVTADAFASTGLGAGSDGNVLAILRRTRSVVGRWSDPGRGWIHGRGGCVRSVGVGGGPVMGTFWHSFGEFGVLRVDGQILVVAGSTVMADAFATMGLGAGE